MTPFEPWRGAGIRSSYDRVDTPEIIMEMQQNILEHLRENEVLVATKDSISKPCPVLFCFKTITNFFFLQIICATKDSSSKNSYIAQLLGILESLVNYGFYSSDEQLKMIPCLVAILDGSTGENYHNNLLPIAIDFVFLSTDYYPEHNRARTAAATVWAGRAGAKHFILTGVQ